MSNDLKLDYSGFHDNLDTISLLGEEIGTIEVVNHEMVIDELPFMYVFRHTRCKYNNWTNENGFIALPYSSMARKGSKNADILWTRIEIDDYGCCFNDSLKDYEPHYKYLKTKMESLSTLSEYLDFIHLVNKDHVWDISDVSFDNLGIDTIYYFGSEHSLIKDPSDEEDTTRSTLHKMKKMVEDKLFDYLEKRAEETYKSNQRMKYARGLA